MFALLDITTPRSRAPGPNGLDPDKGFHIATGAGTAGGISTTAADLGKFAGTGFGTTLLSEPLGKDRLTGASMGDFSLGVGLYGLDIGVRGDWVGHEGQLIGWEANSWYNTKTGAVVVLLTNSSGSMVNATAALTDYYPELATYWNPTQDEMASAKNLPEGYPVPAAERPAVSASQQSVPARRRDRPRICCSGAGRVPTQQEADIHKGPDDPSISDGKRAA